LPVDRKAFGFSDTILVEFNLEYLPRRKTKEHFRKEYDSEIKLGYLDITLEMTFVGQISH
jgi:hypothetical protein